MILKQLVIDNFGPFAQSTTLEIDPEVTILTGQNDVGKSSVLRLVHLLCNRRVVVEDDVNTDHFYESSTHWTINPAIACIATFALGTNPGHYVNDRTIATAAEVDIRYRLAPEAGRQWEIIAARFPDGSRSEYQEHQAQAMSRLLSLPVEHEIRSTLDTSNLNALEKQFLELAFGQNITKARGLSGPLFRQQMRNGNERLNDKLRTILPASMELKFVLDRMADDPLMFSVHLRDKQGSETLLHTRGSGLRKILTLLVGLMNLNLTVENVLIVSDEPEISLHADNQHLLRTFLEEL